MKDYEFRRCGCALAISLAAGMPAAAQNHVSYTYPQVTQQQCDDDTGLWSLWQALDSPTPQPVPAPQPPQINSTLKIFSNGKLVAVLPNMVAGAGGIAQTHVPGAPPPAPAGTPPLFPLATILAALQAVPLSQPLPDPSTLDPGEEYFSPNSAYYMQNWFYDAPQYYPGFASNKPGFWEEAGAYAQAANDYERQNFPQAIKEFDAIVDGTTPAPDYRAAAAYSAARADFRIGNFADGATRISKVLADPSLAQFWPQAWNLIDRTRTGGDIAPLAAAELLQESALMQQPSASLCDYEPYQQLGLMAVYGMSPAKGMPFEIAEYGWGGGVQLVQPGIDYAMAHDPVVNAALQMYKSAATDRRYWQQTHNPLWALSLGADGTMQDILLLNDAIANIRDRDNWPNLLDRARAGLVWMLAMDEAQILLKSGEESQALAALSIPTNAEKAAFDLPDPSGNIQSPVSVPPDWVTQATDMAVNGGTQALIVQAAVTMNQQHSLMLDQQPKWRLARQWAIAASTVLHQPVANALKPVLVENIDELYEHPILHLTPDPLTGEISLTPFRTLYDDWTSAQLIAFSRRSYVAPADKQAMVGAAWIRAFALHDWRDVFGWLPDVRANFPQLAPDTDRIEKAWLPVTKRHLALLLALKVPGFVAQPSDGRGMGIPTGVTWGVNVNANDVFAFDDWNPSDGNWWCPVEQDTYWVLLHPTAKPPTPEEQLERSADQIGSNPDMYTYPFQTWGGPDNADADFFGFVPVGRFGDGGAELNAVRATGSSTQRMAEDAVMWGKNSNWLERVTGGDEYLPEALHLAVRATRYGCRRPADNGPWSRAAFVMLHDRFPKSVWAAQTPYWFGNMIQDGQ